MSVVLGNPYAWLLVPLVVFAGWKLPALALHRPLRAAALFLWILILSDPQIPRIGAGMDLWVLVDRSRSAESRIEPLLAEWEGLLAANRGANDRLFVVDYAESPLLRENTAERNYPSEMSRSGTRSGLAVEFALARMQRDRAARLLVLTDGQSTDPLDRLPSVLQEREVPLDYRLLPQPGGVDYQIAELRVPQRVLPGAGFLVSFDVDGTLDGEVPYTVQRDGKSVGSGAAQVINGSASVQLTDRLVQPGIARYVVEIFPAEDSVVENNKAEAWVEVAGRGSVLLVTAYPDDPVARLLRSQGMTVDVVNEPRTLDSGHLAGRTVLMLNNVAAQDLPPAFAEAVEFAVTHQGVGLMMGGGRQSFGAGGFFETGIGELLPVSMEMRQDQRKLAVAMAIVLDRSGSMGAGVDGTLTKMDLANDGVVKAIELLGAQDAVAVYAVDSSAHVIAPLSQLGADRGELVKTVRGIQSMGGGIFVYTGLKAAWDELEKVTSGQKHIVLFADAQDAEEPGEYMALLKEITDAGATVSAIGLGSDTDVDAAFLRDIALRGNGRVFFNADAAALPQLFAQETVTLARSAFLDEPTPLSGTSGWLEMAARPLDWLPAVDGYNLSYLKPGATAAAITTDEESAPLVAFWQRGAGRTAAITFPVSGDHSEAVRGWSQYGDLVQSVVRWIAAEDLPPGISLRTRRQGDVMDVELFYDVEWGRKFINTVPQLSTASGRDEPATHTWERLAPGSYFARIPVLPDVPMSGAVNIGDVALPFGPVVRSSHDEWTIMPQRITDLSKLSTASGGRELADFSQAWERPPARSLRSLLPYLLPIFLVIFIAEALVTRLRAGMQ